MTFEHDPGERLRAALTRSVGAYTSPPAPVERILAAGRARRARRRRAAVVGAAVAVAAVAGLALPLGRHGGPARPLPAGPGPTAHRTVPAAAVTADVGRGTVDGRTWSVRLEYHPAAAAAGAGAPGSARDGLLCKRMSVGGVLIDHQGGPWADCDVVSGARDITNGDGDEGLWGLHEKGTSGLRLFVASPGPDVAYGVVTLTDGTQLTGRTVEVAATAYRAWAVAIPSGRTIAAVDQYDTSHHRVGHETEWR
ncbi:hypothetical protein [Streptomyces sp. HPF1205]|uniref:hypothetical protein n=1 Tax=Streptomyces sp. HPF1205 TaxID=2873262 RepID=UPI001CED8FDB|nr:hypothetical protein [Streptomyces sp. HPF1205]